MDTSNTKTLNRPSEPESVSGLRTRYTPRSRINQGLISLAPWLDLVLVLLMFAMFESKFVVRPGVVVNLPEGPCEGGTVGGAIAVVVPVEAAGGEPPGELVFFDDMRFRYGDGEDMAKLKARLSDWFGRHPAQALVIEADARVKHGTVSGLYNMAAEVGVPKVNLASRAP